MSLAETITKGEREIYFDFAKNNTIDAESVLSAGFPTHLVDRRKWCLESKIYCLSDFCNCISFVESTFLNSLRLKMMMAYSNNNLVYTIKCHLTKNKIAFANCSPLSSKDHSHNQKSLMYVLDRYINTRGMYFVKHIGGSNSSNIRKEIDSQVTRLRVANVVACSESVSKIKSGEKQKKDLGRNEGTNSEQCVNI